MAEDAIDRSNLVENKNGPQIEKAAKLVRLGAIAGVGATVAIYTNQPELGAAAASLVYTAPYIAKDVAEQVGKWVEKKMDQAQNLTETTSNRISIWASRNIPARPGLRAELAETQKSAQTRDIESKQEIRSLQRQIDELKKTNEMNLQRGDILAQVAVDLTNGDFEHVAALARQVDLSEATDTGTTLDKKIREQGQGISDRARNKNNQGRQRRQQKRPK